MKNEAPKFKSGLEAVKWMEGKVTAAPKGTCTDRFGSWAFKKAGIKPARYLNIDIEVITPRFRANQLDAAVIREPFASKMQREGIARRAASGESLEGIEGEEATFLVALYELARDRPDVHRGWLEAELDAQLFIADPSNANAVAKMAEDQSDGFSRETLWYSLFGSNPPEIGGGENKVTYDFIVNEKVQSLISVASRFLASRKGMPYPQLRKDAVMDQMAREILTARGLSSPIGAARQQPDTAFKALRDAP